MVAAEQQLQLNEGGYYDSCRTLLLLLAETRSERESHINKQYVEDKKRVN